MRCPSCGNETREVARFCDTCGVPIAARCAACGTLNRSSAQFCDGCGSPLTASRTPPSPGETARQPPAPPPSSFGVAIEDARAEPQNIPDGERKTVTALFADIKGSTEMMRDLDPEEARAIVDPALKLMIDAAHRYDGYVVQSTGDGIFALFGAPVAHEDHPQRALHTALAMRDALRRSGEELKKQDRSGVEVRIGSHQRRYAAAGRGLFRAARPRAD